MRFTVEDHGSVVLLRFKTQKDADRADTVLATESWQWRGRLTLVIDHRYAQEAIEYLTEMS